MRIALLSAGTRGDMQPFAALASELVLRGHDVRLTVTADLEGFVRASGATPCVFLGVSMRAMFDSEGGRTLLARGDVLRFLRVMQEQQARHTDALIDGVLAAVEGADLIVSHPLLEVAGRGLAKARGIRQLRTQLAPVAPTRLFSSPLLGGGAWLFGKRLSHWLAFQLFWRAEKPGHLAGCRRLGIAPEPGNPHLLLERLAVPSALLVSPTLLSRPSDWASHHVQTGHCALPARVRDGLGEARTDPALLAWLERGDPPIFFGFGSMPVLDPEATLGMIRRVAERLGRRALVGAGWTSLATGDVGSGVFVAAAFDHDRVLPRCIAAVHHGGLGTTTACLGAGLPAVVCEVLGDQAFWAVRLCQLGVGARLPYRRLSEAGLHDALAPLLHDAVRARALRFAADMQGEQGLVRTADFVERAGQ